MLTLIFVLLGSRHMSTTIDFDDLFRREYRRMVAFAYSQLGSTDDAEEAVQGAFVKAWEHRADFDAARGKPGQWLRGFVKNRVRAIRGERVRWVPVGGWEDEFGFEFEDRPVESNGLPCMADDDTRNRVEALLNVLTPREKTVIELHALQGLTVVETAKRLDITVSAAESAVIRARRRIVEHLHQIDMVAAEPTWQQKQGVLSAEAELVRRRADLLNELTERQRQVLILRYIKLMPGPAVAKRLGIAKATVRHTTAMARRRLRAAAPELVSA